MAFGKYLLLHRIAAGGMAEIYRARYVAAAGVTKEVVIKRILPHFADNPHFVSMFVNEARIAAGLTHGNIAQVFDFGEIGGEYFLAMEYVDGIPLSRLVRRAGEAGVVLPAAPVAFIGAEIARGLAYAHGRADERGAPVGIVHRDVSPQNVMLSFAGEVKLLDFGIAKARGSLGGDTEHGALKGKYVYFSPEQARGKGIDALTDVYATGTVLYECLTGRLPLEGKMVDVLDRIVRGAFERPREVNPGVPAELEGIVLTAMATDKAARYRSAQALAEALTGFVSKAAPRTSPDTIANLVQYLCGDDLSGLGRPVRVSDSFRREAQAWQKTRAPRSPPGPQSLGASGAPDAAPPEVLTRADRGLSAPVPPAPPPALAPKSPRTFRPTPVAVAAGAAVAAALFAVVVLGRPTTFRIRVLGRPMAARVLLDGAPAAARLPATLTASSARDHHVRVMVDGEAPFEATVAAARGGTVEVRTPFGDAGLERPVIADPAPAVEAPAETTVNWPVDAVAVDAHRHAFSVPGSRAARMRLDPHTAYELTVEGQATLGAGRAIVRRALYYAEPARDARPGDARFGALEPGRTAAVRSARALYAWLFDDRPAGAGGALKVRVRPAGQPRAAAVLLIDPTRHAFAPPRSAAVRIAGLSPTTTYRLQVRGSASLSPGDAVGAVLFWTDAASRAPTRVPALPARALGEASQGVLARGAALTIAGVEQVDLTLPDDAADDNAGELTVRISEADSSPAR